MFYYAYFLETIKVRKISYHTLISFYGVLPGKESQTVFVFFLISYNGILNGLESIGFIFFKKRKRICE